MTKILSIVVLILALASSAALIVTAADTAGVFGSKASGDVCEGHGGVCVIADFVASPLEGKAPLKVQFLDTSTGYPTMWVWDFGDGSIVSGAAEPSHTYSEPGIYSVTLTASSQSGGKSIKTRHQYIKVLDSNPLEADFLASPTNGKAPLTVQFTDCSKGDVTNWAWDFGDGSYGAGQNPIHVYQIPGKYTVRLTVSSPVAGSDTKIKEQYITVEPGCVISANFRAEPSSGYAPLTVRFTDCSTSSPTMWAWDFGDGGMDTTANPTHTFTRAGTYRVRLTASSQICAAGTKESTITVNPPAIQADFTANPTTGFAPLRVSFNDCSTGSPTMWAWDFGDGSYEAVADPVHIYSRPGIYTVTLTASNQYGVSTTVKSGLIRVTEECISADFSGSPRSGKAPLRVQFTDLSAGSPELWTWNFGDGKTDNVPNPSHTYTLPGIYQVSMTASKRSGASDTEVKKAYITVQAEEIDAEFTGEPREGRSPLMIQFRDSSIGNPTMWRWDFGDGSTDMVANPKHTYSRPGRYCVTLTASTQYGASDTVTKQDYIIVKSDAISADFSASPKDGPAPLTVQFKDCSIGRPTMWAWNFGDGATASTASPTYTYRVPGCYDVTMTASDQYGTADTEVKKCYIIVLSDQIDAEFTADKTSGCNPLTVRFTDRSSGNPTIWAWDFGDGSTDTVAHPVHKYNQPGCYSVSLTVTSQNGGSDTIRKQSFIVAENCNPLSAEFTADKTSGCTPLAVRFTDRTSGNPTMWAWDFGDGSSDMVANPVHTYSKPGCYSVSLTATSQDGRSDTIKKQNFINIQNCNPFSTDFSGTPRSGSAPLTVEFSDLTTGNPTMWAWDFGDGSREVIANPVHSYACEGKYSVTLTSSNQNGESDTEIKTDYITVSGTPARDKIPLSFGWNFVSVPKKLAEGSNTASIFKNVDVGGHSIFQYDAANHVWNAMVISSQVKPLDSFWIYSTKADSVPLLFDTNPVQVPPTKDLKKGWNGIGFTGLSSLEAKYTLLSVEKGWANCAGYNAAIQQYEQMIIRGSNDGTLMQPYKGYWLYMSEDGILASNGA